MGAEVDIIAYLTGRYFGLRAFGEIYGYAFATYVLAGAFAACHRFSHLAREQIRRPHPARLRSVTREQKVTIRDRQNNRQAPIASVSARASHLGNWCSRGAQNVVMERPRGDLGTTTFAIHSLAKY